MLSRAFGILCLLICLGVVPVAAAGAQSATHSESRFDDRPLQEAVTLPSWFRLSFLDLREDLADAMNRGKRGLVVYFGQDHCPYCRQLMEVDFGKRDIVEYTRRHFDVVAVDVWGDRPVTDMQGHRLAEKAFAEREKTTFTPTLVFYDSGGNAVFRLRGYHPPYQFRAALEYVADGHYRKESFRSYLERANPSLSFEPGGLNDEDFFAAAPYMLDRSRRPGERPLIVFFEQRDCHACDVLHTEPLQAAAVRKQLRGFDIVQLNMWSDTPVISPGGEQTTARKWADRLGLYYAPTLVFFDRRGAEVLRVDSVVHLVRLRGVLDYILSGAYERGIGFQHWQHSRAKR